ncbi:MAG: hypothetical protein FWH08_03335 [Oscillospiraceae bacterium]|nr:hypothetical protein [Oscillospiraceae bacterium]
MLIQALQLGLYGLAGVFGSLVILFMALKITVKLFPYKDENESQGSSENNG